MPSSKAKRDRTHAPVNPLIQELRNEGQYAHVPDGPPDDVDNALTCTCDLRGRMVSATVGGTATTYGYDHEGIRIGQTTGAQSRAFLYDKLNPTGYAKAIEEHASGGLDRSYVLGLRVEGQWDAAGPAWFIRDGHGSNRLLADGDGAPVELYDYAAYGEAVCKEWNGDVNRNGTGT